MKRASMIRQLKTEISDTVMEMYRTAHSDTHDILENCKARGRYYGLLIALNLFDVEVHSVPHFDGSYFFVTGLQFTHNEPKKSKELEQK